MRFLILAAVLALAACGQEADDIRLQEISCPAVQVPPYGRDLVVWNSAGRDLTDLQYRVRIADVTGSCTQASRNPILTARVTVTLAANRGPAMDGRDLTANYTVAVMRRSQIIDEQSYSLSGQFQPNTDDLILKGEPVRMTLPISADLEGSDYTIEAFMTLTQAQLNDNIAASRR